MNKDKKVRVVADSKRLINLRNHLIKTIPKSPNNRETKSFLEKNSFSNLLLHYVSWLSRFVSVKKRKPKIELEVTSHPKWSKYEEGFNYLKSKVNSGEDLTPHLSRKIYRKGFVLPGSKKLTRWDDKDFILNAMGYHHFHLGTKIEKNGLITGTNEVLFARVSPDLFEAIALFDHSVFESDSGRLTPEREKLWDLFDKHTRGNHPPGTVILSSVVTSSGHPLHLVSLVGVYLRILSRFDSKIDDVEFVKSMFADNKIDIPPKPKLEWRINCSGIGIYEKSTNYFFIMQGGLN